MIVLLSNLVGSSPIDDMVFACAVLSSVQWLCANDLFGRTKVLLPLTAVSLLLPVISRHFPKAALKLRLTPSFFYCVARSQIRIGHRW